MGKKYLPRTLEDDLNFLLLFPPVATELMEGPLLLNSVEAALFLGYFFPDPCLFAFPFHFFPFPEYFERPRLQQVLKALKIMTNIFCVEHYVANEMSISSVFTLHLFLQ